MASKGTEPPAPAVFTAKGLRLLSELEKNNTSEWYQEHKALFTSELLEPARRFLEELDAASRKAGWPLRGDPKKGLFRMNRDVRFSADKSPYKTHVGLVLTRTGDRHDVGAAYVHIKPGGESYVACGFWQPDSTTLRRFRSVLIEDGGAGFLRLSRAIERSGLAFEPGEKLRRPPPGTPPDLDARVTEFLTWKSFVVTRPLTDAEVKSQGLAKTVLETIRQGLPLLRFGFDKVGLEIPGRKSFF